MIPYLVVCTAAFLTAGLTLISGFGLGTILMPVFALFFPVEVAVAATAVVHFAHNVFKVGVVGVLADRSLVLRFGLPAMAAALVGAVALGLVARVHALVAYNLGPLEAEVTPIKLVMAVLMLVFAMFELVPVLRRLRFGKEHLVLGGVLSGFFGGFSGHQGALRAAFLARVSAKTETFVGTNAVLGFLVDVSRLLTYAALFFFAGEKSPVGAQEWPLIFAGIGAAFFGVILGKRYLHAIRMKTIQTLTGILLLMIAAALGAGLV